MTGPVSAADATVEGVQANAAGLGLAWQMKIGTVLAGGDADAVTLLMDGDNLTVVKGMSMVGPLATGARVYVVVVPPAGLYVAGLAGGDVTRALTTDQLISPSAALTLDTTDTLVPGMTITVILRSAGRYAATAFIDFAENAAGATTCLAMLYVDGVVVTDEQTGLDRAALFEVSTTADRATVGQQWVGDLSAGSHTFEIRARKTVAVGTCVVNTTHSTLRVTTYE